LTFAWEPFGTRFAMVSTNDPAYDPRDRNPQAKFNIDFYQLDSKKGDFGRIAHLDGKMVNTITWSPKGRFIAFASRNNPSRFDLEFWDMEFTVDEVKKDGSATNVELLGSAEHYGVTDVLWDPSGRYLTTVGYAWQKSPEPGYILWDFKGQELRREQLEAFKQFLWRPRPPTLLTKEQQRKIRRDLKEYSRGFDEEDAAEENRGSAEKLAQRKRDIAEWDAWRLRNVAELAKARKELGKEIVRAYKADAADEKVEEWVEELIDEVEEVTM